MSEVQVLIKLKFKWLLTPESDKETSIFVEKAVRGSVT